jgi:hypothetical protein
MYVLYTLSVCDYKLNQFLNRKGGTSSNQLKPFVFHKRIGDPKLKAIVEDLGYVEYLRTYLEDAVSDFYTDDRP